MNNSESPEFPNETTEYWNAVGEIMFKTSVALTIFTCILLIIFCVCFLWRIYHKSEIFCKSYYYILLPGWLITALILLLNILSLYLSSHEDIDAWHYLTVYGGYYFSPFYGFWNTVLALNRFTALYFFKQHKRLWSGTSLKIILGCVFLYPIALRGYTFTKAYCIGNRHKFKAGEFEVECALYLQSFGVIPISNMVNLVIALILGLATVYVRQVKKQSFQTKQKYESYLLIQSITSTTFLMVIQINNYVFDNVASFSNENDRMIVSTILAAISNFGGMAFNIVTSVLILCLSKATRDSFISFYRIPYILRVKYFEHLREDSDKVTVISLKSV